MIKSLFLAALLLFVVLLPGGVEATHSWGGYHWARTANPFTLKLGDNVSSQWDPILATTSADWTLSSVLDTQIVTGGTTPKRCRATTGRVEVCNSTYGNNGWLGIAQIWTNGVHITKGATKVNDTYFNTPTYNSTAWRNLVMCQEVGHNLGLDHQDEVFDNPNLGTCMDYTNDPTPNQHPNVHDYEELGIIYAHLDSTNTVFQSTFQKTPFLQPGFGEGGDLDQPSSWGKVVRENAQTAKYERELGNGQKMTTFVIWAKR